MASPESVVAEYAKSNRSSCKACSKTIESKALRLGLVSRDKKRGFDVTKWHHLHCFPLPSHSSSADSITGFSSLKVSLIFSSFLFFYPNKMVTCGGEKLMRNIITINKVFLFFSFFFNVFIAI